MPSQQKLDALYMDLAHRVANMSHARRKKVGAIVVHGDNIISMGWNGMPRGANNNCEINVDGELVTNPEVLHAESNAIAKLASTDGGNSEGSTVYVSLSPCFECAKLLVQSKITRVVYREHYRDVSGIELLKKYNIDVTHLPD